MHDLCVRPFQVVYLVENLLDGPDTPLEPSVDLPLHSPPDLVAIQKSLQIPIMRNEMSLQVHFTEK